MGRAELSFGESKLTLPIIEGTEGERAVDISKLRAQSGLITLDSGYVNTGSCQSKITFIDGEKGILRYRGYAIEDVCRNTDFLETAYLVIYGELPSQEQYSRFRADIVAHQEVDDGIFDLIQTFPSGAHPMSAFISAVSSLSAYYGYDTHSEEQKSQAIIKFIAKLPTIAAWVYRGSKNLPKTKPDPKLSYAANFLQLMFSGDGAADDLDPDVVKALDLLLILHADHEQNCSAATVRIVGSSMVNLFAAVVGGMCALWGPLHGGANQAVIEMLSRIHADGGNIQKYIDMAKDKSNGFRLMGFGHRVYKNFDPRAGIIKRHCDLILDKLEIDDPLLNLAKKLEEAALGDAYFVDRKLFPNVDFYSGIIYKALGIPTHMFTVMFALGRLPGWIGQWRELLGDPSLRIGRPRQVYQGEQLRTLNSLVTDYS